MLRQAVFQMLRRLGQVQSRMASAVGPIDARRVSQMASIGIY